MFILHISNLHVDMIKLTGCDSQAIGVYQQHEMGQIYILTSSMNLFLFNSKSGYLKRKADLNFILTTLLVREYVDFLLNKNDGFKISAKHDQHMFEFDIFESIFKKRKLLMGLGSHKILDFLNIGLNMPLNYHPTSFFDNDYTKSLQDMLN